MNAKTPLELKVTLYHEQRLKKWYRILILVATLLATTLGIVSFVTWYVLSSEHSNHHILSHEHSHLKQQWSIIKAAAKKFKAHQAALTLLNPSSLPIILETIADIIPAHTLITTFTFKAPQTFMIKGYSESEEELGTFIERIGSKFPVMLSSIAHYPHAYYFEIVSKARNLKPKAPTRHS